MQILGVIPARFASSRFPGKPLVKIKGITMIQRVYLQASKANSLSKLIVATDDKRIHKHVQSFGGQSLMTSPNHLSGTDRCAEIAIIFQDMEAIINIQGDEPYIHPQQIELVCKQLQQNTALNLATLAKKITNIDELISPNIVKVVFNQNKIAHYFSRSPIPFIRGVEKEKWLNYGTFYKHIGLYGYRRKVLLDFAQLPQSRLEKLECLEQLRWLENGYKIGVGLTNLETMGIDTPEDLEQLVKTIEKV